jgi:hypothetical protein
MRAQTHVVRRAWKRHRIHVTLFPSCTTAPCSAPAPQVTSRRNSRIPHFSEAHLTPLRQHRGIARCNRESCARVPHRGIHYVGLVRSSSSLASAEIRRTLSVEIGTRVRIHTASRGRRYPLTSIRIPQPKPSLRNCVVSSVWQKTSLLVCSEDPSSL